jgi:hypothetical protein
MIKYSTCKNNKNNPVTKEPMGFESASADKYEKNCKQLKNCYEVIPDDVPVCLYFDIDSKHDYGTFEYFYSNTLDFIELAKNALIVNCHGYTLRFAVAVASSPDFVDETGKRKMCHSIHIHVPNIKMLKSDQKIFCDKMNDFMNTDPVSKQWVDYLGQGNGKFFDDSIYNPSGKLRSVHCSKVCENRPLVLVEGTFKDTIISLGDEDAIVFEASATVKAQSSTKAKSAATVKATAKPLKAHGKQAPEKIKALCEIIDQKFICAKGCYADWRNILWSLRSESPDYKELARAMSNKPGADFDNAVFEATWDSYQEGKMHISKFYNYAKKSNPEKYAEIMQSGNETRHCLSDLDAANIIYEDLGDRLKSVDGRFFFNRDNLWISDSEAIRSALMYETMNSNIYSEVNEKTCVYSPYVQNISRARHVVDALLLKVANENNDRSFYQKFHTSTTDKICFNDGVLDFKNKSFTLWEDLPPNEVFTTVKIKRNFKDYFDNPDRTVIDEIKENILKPLYGEKLETALHFLSRALAGHHDDKRWSTYLGNRHCGKSLEYDILRFAFEQYVTTFELGNMLYCRRSAGMENVDCSKKLYWLMDLEFVRLAVSQEIPESKSGLIVNSKILKKVTGGGDEIVARRNYDRFDTHFFIDATFYIKGNYSLLTDSPDCDETRLEFQSVVQFKSKEEIERLKETRDPIEMQRYKVADPTIKEKCRDTEWMNAMVYLIFESYKDRPVDVFRDVDDEDDGSLTTALRNRFEFTNDDTPMLVSEVVSLMSEFDKKKLDLELAARNVFKKKHTKSGELRLKWCYYGLKRVVSCDEDK